MKRFSCKECVLHKTEACPYGFNEHQDYEEICQDTLIDHDYAFEKAVKLFEEKCFKLLDRDERYGYMDITDVKNITKELLGENNENIN